MLNLLKSDFYKVIKSKLFVVILSIVGIASIVFTGVYALVNYLASSEVDATYMTFQTSVTSSLSLTTNVGIIVPIFAGIIICNDITSGSLRNKVIIGKDRTLIYISHFIVSMVFNIGIMVVYAGLSAIWGIILLPTTGFDALSFFTFLISGLFAFAFLSSFTTFVALSTKSVPLTIILTIIINVALSFIIAIIPEIFLFLPDGIEKLSDAKIFFAMIPTFTSSSSLLDLIVPETPTNTQIISRFFIGLASDTVFILLFTLLGIFNFRKKDIK